MNKKDFYRFIEGGALEGSCRYFEYWYIYSHTPKKTRVLDLGAGRSMLPSALKKAKCDVHATEIDMKRIAFQVERGVPTSITIGSKLDYPDKYFDVVINASAIEHFSSDVDTISEVSVF